ncbi:MAG: T9SS type A sorting domain-containing protein [Bacteroidota bacterium]
MRKISYIFLMLLFGPIYVMGQTSTGYGSSISPCSRNVNSVNLGDDHQNNIRATVKMYFPGPGAGSCSGTLVNRDVSQSSLGQYILTANHCFDGVPHNGGVAEVHLIFNFQSRDGENESMPFNARGFSNGQNGLTYLQSNRTVNGYRHIMRSARVRKVESFSFGDMALYEIIDQIPPHFNPYYAGWATNHVPLVAAVENYRFVHHAKGDIKKLATSPSIKAITTPIATACRTITKIIDFLFGWIWKRRYSTEVICNYTESPFYQVLFFNRGAIQEGASGSAMFSPNDNYIGTCSYALGNCANNPSVGYGKFRSNYLRAAIKTTLNPSGRAYTDAFGIRGRQISCYNSLTNLNGQYFPAGDYQSNNHIQLSSANSITTLAETFPGQEQLIMYPGSEFTFNAGNEIIINPGMTIDPGATFTTNLVGCTVPGIDIQSPAEPGEEPDYLKAPIASRFNAEEYAAKYLAGNESGVAVLKRIQIFPNPSSGLFNINISYYGQDDVEYKVTNYMGQTVKEGKTGNGQFQLDLSGQPKGFYSLMVTMGSKSHTEKLILN